MEKVTDIYWSIKKGSPQTTDCPENKRKSKQNRVRFCLPVVETTRLELVTPCMSSKYSNQLSYASELFYNTINGENIQAILIKNKKILQGLVR